MISSGEAGDGTGRQAPGARPRQRQGALRTEMTKKASEQRKTPGVRAGLTSTLRLAALIALCVVAAAAPSAAQPRAGYTNPVAAGDFPTQPFSQVLGNLVMSLSHDPPPSAAYPGAIEESGRQIKASAYVGISELLSEQSHEARCG